MLPGFVSHIVSPLNVWVQPTTRPKGTHLTGLPHGAVPRTQTRTCALLLNVLTSNAGEGVEVALDGPSCVSGYFSQISALGAARVSKVELGSHGCDQKALPSWSIARHVTEALAERQSRDAGSRPRACNQRPAPALTGRQKTANRIAQGMRPTGRGVPAGMRARVAMARSRGGGIAPGDEAPDLSGITVCQEKVMPQRR